MLRLSLLSLLALAAACAGAAGRSRAGPELPPPGKLGLLVDGDIDAGTVRGFVRAIRDVHGRDIHVIGDPKRLEALRACRDHACRAAIAHAVGMTHLVYGSVRRLGKTMVRAELSTVMVAAPDGWSTHNLTFAATGFEMRVCETFLADARIYARPLPGRSSGPGPFGACHSEAARRAPLPSVTWTASAANVGARIAEIKAWYDAAGLEPGSNAPEARTLKAHLARKQQAPDWVDQARWSESRGDGDVLFAVGKHFLQPGMAPESGVDAAEAAAFSAAKASAPAPTGRGPPAMVAVDYYFEGVAVYALVALIPAR